MTARESRHPATRTATYTNSMDAPTKPTEDTTKPANRHDKHRPTDRQRHTKISLRDHDHKARYRQSPRRRPTKLNDTKEALSSPPSTCFAVVSCSRCGVEWSGVVSCSRCGVEWSGVVRCGGYGGSQAVGLVPHGQSKGHRCTGEETHQLRGASCVMRERVRQSW